MTTNRIDTAFLDAIQKTYKPLLHFSRQYNGKDEDGVHRNFEIHLNKMKYWLDIDLLPLNISRPTLHFIVVQVSQIQVIFTPYPRTKV